jgi:hypothetical protein
VAEFFWVAELFWQNSAKAELGRTSQIRPNLNFGAELWHISRKHTANTTFFIFLYHTQVNSSLTALTSLIKTIKIIIK